MPYQEILSRAWAIFKKQRALWLFGFLSACSGGVYGHLPLPSFNLNLQNPTFETNTGQAPAHNAPPPDIPPEVAHFFEKLAQIPDQTWVLIALGVIAAGLALVILMMLMRSFAEPALVRGILTTIETDQPLSLGETAASGAPFFGRMVLFHLLVGGGVFLSFIVLFIGATLFTLGTFGIGLLCLIPLMFLFIPLGWLLELYFVLSTLALLIEDLGVIDALKRGWYMLKAHFWNSVLMGLLLTVIHIGASIVIFVLAGIIGVPAFIVIAIIDAAADSPPLLLGLGGLLALAIILLIMMLRGLLQTYLESAWVLTYRHYLDSEANATAAPEALEAPAAPAPSESEAEDAPPPDTPPQPAPETS